MVFFIYFPRKLLFVPKSAYHRISYKWNHTIYSLWIWVIKLGFNSTLVACCQPWINHWKESIRLLSIMHLRFIRVAAYISLFLFIVSIIVDSIKWMSHTLFIHLPVEIHLGCFHCRTIICSCTGFCVNIKFLGETKVAA